MKCLNRMTVLTGALILAVGLIGPEIASAQPDNEGNSDRIDITDIEQRFWAPQDTDFEVVQNRVYAKQGRVFLSALYGPIVNDAYSEGNTLAIHGNYYFTERYGIELQYQQSDLKESTFVTTMATQNAGKPDHGRVTGYHGVGFNFVPIYAKMSLMGRRILYFDMQVTPHIGQTTYEQRSNVGSFSQTAFTYGLDVTQYFFFSNNVALRMDLKNRWFSEDVIRYSNGLPIDKRDSNTTLFMLGLSFFY